MSRTAAPPPADIDDGRLPVADRAQAAALRRSLVRGEARAFALATVLLAAGTAAQLAGPALLGAVVDELTADAPSVGVVDRAAVLLALAVLGGAVVVTAGQAVGAAAGERLLAELRRRVGHRLLELPVSRLERAGTGDVLARATTDLHAVSATLRDAVPAIALAALRLVLTVAALLLVSLPLAALAFLAAPVALVATRWYRRRAPAAYRREAEADAAAVAHVVETADAAMTIETLALSPHRRQALAARHREHLDAVMAATRLRNVLRPALSATQLLALVAVVLGGTLGIRAGAVAPGDVAAAALYVLALAGPLNELVEWLDELERGRVSFARLAGVLSEPPHRSTFGMVTHDCGPAGPRATAQGLDVACHGLSYRYRPERPVLRGVDIQVPAATHLAIVGPSGGGKTTLARLIAGDLDPEQGAVLVGGRPLHDRAPEERSALVALVTQETHVFWGTVADDLRMVAPDATDDELWDALEQAGLATLIHRLPDGLASAVGADGHTLALADVQRLALARVVLAGAPVVVLDEATAALGTGAGELAGTVHNALAGRTIISVTHRLELATGADAVAVLAAGEIVEYGRPDALRQDGHFATLLRAAGA